MKLNKLAINLAACAMLAVPCSAQTVVDNVFNYSGSGSEPGPVYASALISLLTPTTETGTLGDGWDTTVEFEAGVIYGLGAEMPNDGTFRIYSNGVAGVLGFVETRRVFSGKALESGGEYTFSIDKSDSAAVSLLTSLEVEIGRTDGVNDTVLVNTADGTGLLGVVDVLGLFGGDGTASFDFDGSDFGGDDLYIKLSSDTLADAVATSATFSNLSIERTNPVPEPSTAGLSMLAGCLLLTLRRRRSA